MCKVACWCWLFALVTSALMAQSAAPQDLERRATEMFRAGDFVGSARLFSEAFAVRPSARSAYNAACSFARAGDVETAFVWLDHALDAGYQKPESLLGDGDLASLRDSPQWRARWESVIARARAAAEAKLAKVGNRALRDELLAMQAEDQRVRAALAESAMDSQALHKAEAVDARHLVRIKEILEVHGWPGKSLVGDDGAQAAWLLVQHADADPTFQRRALAGMKAAVDRGEARASEWAFLVDRVRIAAGEPQLYGTQFRQVAGDFEPLPIFEPQEIDRRRSEVGLEPLAAYRERLRSSYAQASVPAGTPKDGPTAAQENTPDPPR